MAKENVLVRAVAQKGSLFKALNTKKVLDDGYDPCNTGMAQVTFDLRRFDTAIATTTTLIKDPDVKGGTRLVTSLSTTPQAAAPQPAPPHPSAVAAAKRVAALNAKKKGK